jgi:polyhydroxyalkanoate synthesis regulator phasin
MMIKEMKMNEERKRILEMLSEGKINADEAERLLSALSQESESNQGVVNQGVVGNKPRYLRVMVEPGQESNNKDRVNIRIPIKLIRAGLRLASFIPKDAQVKVNEALHEKGIEKDFTNIKPEDIDEILAQINDFTVDVEGKETVKIFCE